MENIGFKAIVVFIISLSLVFLGIKLNLGYIYGCYVGFMIHKMIVEILREE